MVRSFSEIGMHGGTVHGRSRAWSAGVKYAAVSDFTELMCPDHHAAQASCQYYQPEIIRCRSLGNESCRPVEMAVSMCNTIDFSSKGEDLPKNR